MRLRPFLRLNRGAGRLECSFRYTNDFALSSGTQNVQRIGQIINGREYQIEVSSVGLDKWRAQIARVPGGSTATMPFYGKTPDEAAGQLSRWLEIAHGRPAASKQPQ